MDNNITPKVSIITLTKDRATFIPAAIESVLAQTFTGWELIIIDDNSKDDTESIVRKYTDSRIIYIKNNSPLGISSSRNKGLEKAQGKYIAVLDSDDIWTDKEKLRKQFDFLESHPDYVLIGSNIKIISDTGTFIKNTDFPTEDADIRGNILIANPIPHSTVLFKAEAANKVGGYNEKLPCVEDLDLFLRLGKLGKMKNFKETMTSYTRHSGGVSYQRKLSMAWNHMWIVFRNFGKYPHWFRAMFWAKLRFYKNLF
jgi:glycosyltransferase involved in cell wall biosynthesis